MIYNIEKQSLSQEQLLYLENFEQGLKMYLSKEIHQCPNLGVTVKWTVKKRGNTFFNCTHNASFDIKDSFLMQSKIESYIAQKLKLDFSECSILLELQYKTKTMSQENEQQNTSPSSKRDDGDRKSVV